MKKVMLSIISAIAFGGITFSQNTLPTTGNVGIGTINPTEKLSVMGSAKIDSTLIVDSVIVIKGAHVNGKFFAGGETTLNNKLYLPGIGSISSPQDAEGFEVMLSKTGSGIVQKMNFEFVIGELYKYNCLTDLNGNVTNPKWSNGNNKLYSGCNNVRVGIGTTSPSQMLHVVGNSLITGTTQVTGNIAIGAVPSTMSRFLIKNTQYSTGIEVDQSGNTTGAYSKLIHLKFTNATTDLIRVENTSTNQVPFLLEASGRMTIHNGTKKILQLNAEGLLQARRIKCDADNWADYVFDPAYKLMPLSELNDFLILNKHLPNVPSEKEVKENGIDLAEMNMILLEKIEQLTLYMIQQNNATANLKAEIEALQSEIVQLKAK